MVTIDEIWELLEQVNDPEVPVLTIIDLGIVQEVSLEQNTFRIKITPTYSGCPAMKTIEEDIISLLKEKGIENVEVELVLSPAWTTDWISEQGRIKLKEYGIAPPADELDKSVLFSEPTHIQCPKCNSKNTKMVSLFGSTACKAHYTCLDCLEPFDYFKCLR